MQNEPNPSAPAPAKSARRRDTYPDNLALRR